MKNKAIILFVIVLDLFIIGLNTAQKPQQIQEHTPQGISPIVSTKTAQKIPQPIRILFIGNSYTFFHDMPGMIIKIADSASSNTAPLIIQTISGGGLRLVDHWKKGDALKILKQETWHYVILQDNSMWAMYKNLRLDTQKHLPLFTHEIRKVNAVPVFVKTWPRKPNTAWYTEPDYKYALINPKHMHKTINQQADFLTKKLQIDAVPLNDYWMFTIQKHPEINLFEADGTHPNASGSYLNALIFYRYFTGRYPVETTYIPIGITKEDATTLRKIASYGINK